MSLLQQNKSYRTQRIIICTPTQNNATISKGKLLEVGKLKGANTKHFVASSMSNLSNSDNSGSRYNHHALQHGSSNHTASSAAVAASSRFSNVNTPTATDDDRQQRKKLFIHQSKTITSPASCSFQSYYQE